ncbi:MAG: hypothetical protein HY889_08030 [Deltaproteobacteria bacterium]|nr:hypothetical protein [Deltaproteobacteria bacterium]
MGYDITYRLSQLASECRDLDEGLGKAAGIILESSPFDQCDVYLWDEDKRVFFLKASAGTGSRTQSYVEGDGVPGMVKESMGPVAMKKPWSGGPKDAGTDGFGYAYAHPLNAGDSFYGVLYLKSKMDLAAPAFKKDIELAAPFLALMIRCRKAESGYLEASLELGEAREKVERTEKLMALVDMASSLAHEIKNPLISIGGFAARLKRHLGSDSDALPYVEQMLQEVRRVERLIDGIMRFLRDGGASDKHPEDINEILKTALKFFDDDFRVGNISLALDLFEGKLPVYADREQLTIAFDNLIANAIQSMENGGTLTLTTGLCRDSIVVRVADSGGGIDPRNINYIFNPFFTTKKNGTGLGLPIANSIMHMHNGCIEVENEEGVGATFVLKLPLAA